MRTTLTQLHYEFKTAANRAAAANALGLALEELGEHRQAYEYFKTAANIDPQSPQRHNNCARSLLSIGEVGAAVECYKKSLALANNQPDIFCSLGRVYAKHLHSQSEAERCFAESVKRSSKYNQSYYYLCFYLLPGRDVAETRAYAMGLLGSSGDALALQKGLAIALCSYGRYEESKKEFLRALALDPEDLDALCGLGDSETGLSNLEPAAYHYAKALTYHANNPLPYEKYIEHLLRLGEEQKAKSIYRSLAARQKSRTARAAGSHGSFAEWNGSDLERKTILLTIQNLGDGDIIQFIRFAQLLKDRGANVITECRKPLKSLLETMPGVDLAITKYEETPLPDYVCRFINLGFLLDWTWKTIGGLTPYSFPGGSLQNAWKRRLPAAGKLKVGVAWQSSPTAISNPYRSRTVMIEDLRPLAEIEGISLFSLQFGPGAEALRAAEPPIKIHELNVGDYLDTAAAVSALDVVVTVDTSTAHLAGSLGKLCFVMLPYLPCWRWMMERTDTPWYPAMRLFRQSQPGKWGAVVQEIAQALRALSENRQEHPLS
jgi:tetratricopeptide (TPR) repeat protein